MKACLRCTENKWLIKDLQSEIKTLRKYSEKLEDRVDDLECRSYTKKCGYCPRDIIGHYEDCNQNREIITFDVVVKNE